MILALDENMQVFVEMLPIGFAAILILLREHDERDGRLRAVPYFLFISHRATAADHDFAARVSFELLGRHATWSENATDKVELQEKTSVGDESIVDCRNRHLIGNYTKMIRCVEQIDSVIPMRGCSFPPSLSRVFLFGMHRRSRQRCRWSP